MGGPQFAWHAILPRTNTERSAPPSGAIYPQQEGNQGTAGQNQFDEEVWANGTAAGENLHD
jgi:hypothetical protein